MDFLLHQELRETPVYNSIIEANANREIYRLTDNFIRFWYAFWFANFSQLEDGGAEGVYEYLVAPKLHEFAAYTIDLLCINENTKEYLVGECKLKGVPFKHSEYLNTMVKLTPFKESGSFWYVLFSESGFDEKILNEAKKSEHVRLYSMEEVVNFKP